MVVKPQHKSVYGKLLWGITLQLSYILSDFFLEINFITTILNSHMPSVGPWVIIILQCIMLDTEGKLAIQGAKGGGLFDPTSYYYLKLSDYGPLTINNILQGSSC